MSAELVGLALGAAASYSVAKEVPFVRVVFCDAAAYDTGYVAPILLITDGCIERGLQIRHEHAFLIPRGKRLPFRPLGKVFYF